MLPVTSDRLAATRCAEAEAQARKRTDNASERALRAMMGGSLAAAASAGESWVLPRPEWMSGNPKMFTAEQMKVGKGSGREWMSGNPQDVCRRAVEGGEGICEGVEVRKTPSCSPSSR